MQRSVEIKANSNIKDEEAYVATLFGMRASQLGALIEAGLGFSLGAAVSAVLAILDSGYDTPNERWVLSIVIIVVVIAFLCVLLLIGVMTQLRRQVT